MSTPHPHPSLLGGCRELPPNKSHANGPLQPGGLRCGSSLDESGVSGGRQHPKDQVLVQDSWSEIRRPAYKQGVPSNRRPNFGSPGPDAGSGGKLLKPVRPLGCSAHFVIFRVHPRRNRRALGAGPRIKYWWKILGSDLTTLCLPWVAQWCFRSLGRASGADFWPAHAKLL